MIFRVAFTFGALFIEWYKTIVNTCVTGAPDRVDSSLNFVCQLESAALFFNLILVINSRDVAQRADDFYGN